MRLFKLFSLFLLFRCSRSDFTQRNVIVIITDDQDVELGSMNFMPKTLRLFKEKGVEFRSGFVTTPICCPSRSSILSGLYVHNHHVHTNNQNCSGVEWRLNHENRTVNVHMKNAGYRTIFAGKYLNEYDGTYVPHGWDDWLGLVKNSRFYNYTVNLDGQRLRYGFDYETDYFTDLVTNKTIAFISNHLSLRPWQPFVAFVNFPAPHGPEDPAPQFSELFTNEASHRTDSWNYAPNPDKQWLLQRTGKMDTIHVAFTDLLHRRRLQTLQSVDDGVHRLFGLLREHNQLSNTYLLYTSDHGYHLGQYGLIKGKNMPYEFDIRVPYYLRGPSVPRNIIIKQPVGNIDITPTLLSIAGVEKPHYMDGRSLLDLVSIVKHSANPNKQLNSLRPITSHQIEPWRDTILIERGKMPKLKKIRDRWLRQKERYNKEKRLNEECSKEVWQNDCLHEQLWKCYKSNDGKWRIYRCRNNWAKSETCDCQSERTKREVSENGIVDEFLMDTYSRNLMDNREWFQGEIGRNSQLKVGRTRRALEKCGCNRTHQHPLKYLDDDNGLLYNFRYSSRQKEKKKNVSNSSNWEKQNCSMPQMNCFMHSSEHWRTPPLWPEEYGRFCFCQNCNNNTYWCLRTVNSTHNFLYCEFVTEFISYYDLNEDPYQLTNSVYSLEMSVLEQLSEQLKFLRGCKGVTCQLGGLSNWEEHAKNIKRLPGW